VTETPPVRLTPALPAGDHRVVSNNFDTNGCMEKAICAKSNKWRATNVKEDFAHG
jgi:hypothetical protein